MFVVGESIETRFQHSLYPILMLRFSEGLRSQRGKPASAVGRGQESEVGDKARRSSSLPLCSFQVLSLAHSLQLSLQTQCTESPALWSMPSLPGARHSAIPADGPENRFSMFISMDTQEYQVWMLKIGLLGKNLSFNAQIKTDTIRILAERQIHSNPRETAVKSGGKTLSWRGAGGSGARELSGGFPSHSAVSLQAKTSLLGPASAWLSSPLECRVALCRLSRYIESITFGLQPRLIICYESLCNHKIK